MKISQNRIGTFTSLLIGLISLGILFSDTQNAAAYYSPEHGRFISRDPIRYADGPNMYAYVGGQPLIKLDPSGLAGTGYMSGYDPCTGEYNNQYEGRFDDCTGKWLTTSLIIHIHSGSGVSADEASEWGIRINRIWKRCCIRFVVVIQEHSRVSSQELFGTGPMQDPYARIHLYTGDSKDAFTRLGAETRRPGPSVPIEAHIVSSINYSPLRKGVAHTRSGLIIIGADDNQAGGDWKSLAHELGHAVGNLGHTSDPFDLMAGGMMNWGGTWLYESACIQARRSASLSPPPARGAAAVQGGGGGGQYGEMFLP